MKCFKFIKVMMVLFNLLIFVSMEVVGFGGSLQKQVTIGTEFKLGNRKLYPDSAC